MCQAFKDGSGPLLSLGGLLIITWILNELPLSFTDACQREWQKLFVLSREGRLLHFLRAGNKLPMTDQVRPVLTVFAPVFMASFQKNEVVESCQIAVVR